MIPNNFLGLICICLSWKPGISTTERFDIYNNTHFLESTFSHLNGSACCADIVDTTPAFSVVDCSNRCQYLQGCSMVVFQPSTGLCWIGAPHWMGSNTGGDDRMFARPTLVPIRDRIAGISKSLKSALTGTPVLRSRDELPKFLNQVIPGGLGIVLGVGRGDFAFTLLSGWNGGLYLVDPYIHQWKGYDDPANVDDRTHQLVYESVRTTLHKHFESKHVIVRDFSYSFAELWATKKMPNPTFIYVDNNHAAHAVRKDLEAWWGLLAPGGVMAGNMYIDVHENNISTKSAVDKWFGSLGLQERILTTDSSTGSVPNWIVFKNLL